MCLLKILKTLTAARIRYDRPFDRRPFSEIFFISVIRNYSNVVNVLRFRFQLSYILIFSIRSYNLLLVVGRAFQYSTYCVSWPFFDLSKVAMKSNTSQHMLFGADFFMMPMLRKKGHFRRFIRDDLSKTGKKQFITFLLVNRRR